MAQNVGVGTNTPLTKLHIFSGASGSSTPLGQLLVEHNNNSYINILTPNGAESGLLFGNAGNSSSGGIVYNNFGNTLGLQFRTNGNATRMVINSAGEVKIGSGTPGANFDVMRGSNEGGTAIFRGTVHVSHFNHSANEHTYIRAGKNNGFVILNDIPGGRVGINYNNPNAPLGFAPAVGKKITLYPGATGDVGFGVQGNLLQIYSDNPFADIAFGYDQNATGLTERFRMRANGAFLVNGNAGSPGQVLQSNGDGTPPIWSHGTNVLYNNTVFLDNNTQLVLTTSDWVAIPGLNHTFTVTGNAKVLITFSIYTASGSCFGCGSSTMYIDVNLNGGLVSRFVENVANGATHSFAGTTYALVGAGTHTIQFLGSRGGSDGYMGHPFQASHAILQIIPQ